MMRKALRLKEIKVTNDPAEQNCLTWCMGVDTFTANIREVEPKAFVETVLSLYKVALIICGYKRKDIKKALSCYGREVTNDKSAVRIK